MIADCVHDVAKLMSGFNHPWWIAGGWAIDLFIGHVTRPHADIEIAILRSDQQALHAYLSDWELSKITPHGPARWLAGETLKIPVHEIHCKREPGQPDKLEILLNESSDDQWLFRRDPTIRLPLAQLGKLSTDQIPFLAPEVVLLYKAKNPRAPDDDDFASAFPLLDADARAWLRRAIEHCHPGHAWLPRL
jgi:hypothetical protein